jgi:hypothetical protein
MKNLHTYLAYAGTLPFISAALLLALDIQVIPVLGDVSKVLCAYALSIISFISGSYWGKVLDLGNRVAQYISIISNLIVVIVCIGFLTLPLKSIILLFILAFLILLGIDKILLRNKLITRDYFQTRLYVSAIVIIMLTAAGVKS